MQPPSYPHSPTADTQRPITDALLQTVFALHVDTLRYVKRGLVIVALGFCGALLWAGFAPLDKGIAVSGHVVVSNNRKAVQPLNAGRIATLEVREGDRVQAGQVLATLNATPAQAQRDSLRAQWLEACANAARLRAERDGLAAIDFPSALTARDSSAALTNITSLPALRLAQRQLFASRRSAIEQELTAMEAAISGTQAQRQGTQALYVSYQTQYRLTREQLDRLRPLAQEGYIARNRLLEVERQFAQLAGTLAQTQHSIVQLQQRTLELEQTRQQRKNEYQKEVRSQLSDVQLTLQDLDQKLKTAEYALQNTQITAPVSGTVVGLALHTQGAVVSGGQLLMEIVPEDQPLLIDAQLPIQLVDKARAGLPVSLMFTAFNQSTTPRIAGVITLVGADQLRDAQTGQPYYTLRIRVDDEEKRPLSGFNIRPGMPVDAFIRTGERSLLNYLFKPLLDRLHIALTEE